MCVVADTEYRQTLDTHQRLSSYGIVHGDVLLVSRLVGECSSKLARGLSERVSGEAVCSEVSSDLMLSSSDREKDSEREREHSSEMQEEGCVPLAHQHSSAAKGYVDAERREFFEMIDSILALSGSQESDQVHAQQRCTTDGCRAEMPHDTHTHTHDIMTAYDKNAQDAVYNAVGGGGGGYQSVLLKRLGLEGLCIAVCHSY